MKPITLLLSMFLLQHLTPALLVIDTSYHTRPIASDEFNWEMYTGKQFPIYAEDRKAIIEGARSMAKLIDNNPACNLRDAINLNHSQFSVIVRCDDYKTYTIGFRTTIADKNLVCNIQLVNNEVNPKKVQRKLIDFATYLEQAQ